MRVSFVLTALAGFAGAAIGCASASAHDYERYGVRAEARAYQREMAYQDYLSAERKRAEARTWQRENAYQRYLANKRHRAAERDLAYVENRGYHRYGSYDRYGSYTRYGFYNRYRSYSRYRSYGYRAYRQHCDCPPYREYSYVPRVFSYSYHSDLCLP
jgi:hypothetical protein